MKSNYRVTDDFFKFLELKLKEFEKVKKGEIDNKELNEYVEKVRTVWNEKNSWKIFVRKHGLGREDRAV
ncbi:MAG: hypothetical protein AB1485_03730 [Candidatus Thermoplasmatota archaeon]